MRKIKVFGWVSLLCLYLLPNTSWALPKGFVYLDKIAPSIIQNMRYASSYNFIGRPITGYSRGRCILTHQAADKLANIQAQALNKGYSLKVYDCYRPQRAVDDFFQWSKNSQNGMKQAFYPREDKTTLFTKGYIAKYSGHSRGSTVDLSLVPLKQKTKKHRSNKELSACFAPYKKRITDDSVDMGTNYDCLDKSAHVFYKKITKRARYNRYLLRKLMINNGFYPYSKEWWHFTLRNEPFKRQYFNFLVS